MHENMYVININSEIPGQGQVAGSCEYNNEPSGSIKCGEFLDLLASQERLC
jgi:hypothetical protein